MSGARLCEKISGLIFKGVNDNDFQPLETNTLSRNVGFQSPNDVTSHSVTTNTSTAQLEVQILVNLNLLRHTTQQNGNKCINLPIKQRKLTKRHLNF